MKVNKTIFICDENGISLGQLKGTSLSVYVSEAAAFFSAEGSGEEIPDEEFKQEAIKRFKKFYRRSNKNKDLTQK